MGALWASKLSSSKHVFQITCGKQQKMLDNVKQQKMSSNERAIIRYGLFEKVSKIILFKVMFVSVEKYFETTCVLELDMALFDIFDSRERASVHRKRAIVHKTLPCFA